MNKKYIYGLLALTILSGVGLPSCSSEEDIAELGGEKVMLTIRASKNADDTRTAFEEKDGNLNCTWTEGDQLLVTSNSTGARLGVITLAEGAGQESAVFRGEVVLDDYESVNLFYLGKDKAIPSSITTTDYVIDVTNQDGSFESLAKNDFLAQGDVQVSKLNGEATGSTELLRYVAQAHFNLQLPNNATLKAGDIITISQPDGAFKTTMKVKYKTTGSVIATNENNTMTITKAEDGNDIYVTMIRQTNVVPTFTVSTGGKVYSGTLASHDWAAGTYVRAADGNGIPVVLQEEPQAETDGEILGVKWASVNTRSYIDCATWDDDAYYFSYIPGISLAEQGLSVKHVDQNIINPNNNPYAYHYQWGRNFGFPASTGGIADTHVPNYLNLSLNWPNDYLYYSVYNGAITAEQSISNPDVYIVRTNGAYDWCSSTLSDWPLYYDEENDERMSVAPVGYRLPTEDDFLTLLPEGQSGNTYTATKTFSVDGETIRPFFAKQTAEGTTVIWAVLNSSTMNYMALYELKGKYTLANLTADLFGDNGKVIDYVDFPAQGSRSARSTNPSKQDWQTRGWYWSSTSAAAGYARILRFDISENSITIYVASLPKVNALSVRCVKE